MSTWVRLIASAGERIAESEAEGGQVYRILEEDLRRAATELNKAQAELSEQANGLKAAESKCLQLKKKMHEYEGYVMRAFDQENELLAKAVVEQLARLEEDLQQQEHLQNQIKVKMGTLRASVCRLQRRSQQLKQQADTFSAAKTAHRARLALVADTGANDPALYTAIDAYKKAKSAQKDSEAVLSEGMENSNAENELLHKLEEAGIKQADSKKDALFEKMRKQYLASR